MDKDRALITVKELIEKLQYCPPEAKVCYGNKEIDIADIIIPLDEPYIILK